MLLSEMLKDGRPLVSGSVLRFGMPAAVAGCSAGELVLGDVITEEPETKIGQQTGIHHVVGTYRNTLILNERSTSGIGDTEALTTDGTEGRGSREPIKGVVITTEGPDFVVDWIVETNVRLVAIVRSIS